VAEIASAIQEAMAMSPEALNVMGQKGRKLVEEKYSWDKIAQEYSNAYQCLLNMHNISHVSNG
jgi:glycosyltransferase involved in cell wall biosynthesis